MLTLKRARTKTVDALNLIRANDDVLEGGAVLELEDRVGGPALLLPGALDAAAVGFQTTVESARDDLGFLVRHGALGGRDVEAVAALDELGGRRGGGADGEGAEDGGGEDAEGWHC